MYKHRETAPHFKQGQYRRNSFATQFRSPLRRHSSTRRYRDQYRPRQSLDTNYTLRDSVISPLNYNYYTNNQAGSSYCPSSARRRFSYPTSTAISFPFSSSYPNTSTRLAYSSNRPTSRAPSTYERYYTAATRHSPSWLFDGIEFSPDRTQHERDNSFTSEYGTWSTKPSRQGYRRNRHLSSRSSPSSSSFSQF
ncbi:uncharacterized protein LOC142341115 isoform X2 [Convolutriloba macropyga]